MRLVTESATAARTTLDAAVGQIGRVEQLVELFRREVRHLGRDILDPPILPVGSLGNLRAEIVADDRVQRGDHDRILVDEVGNVLRVDGETGYCLVGEYVRRGRKQLDREIAGFERLLEGIGRVMKPVES